MAIFILSVCIFEALKKADINVQQFAGHSLGEITAYFAAGVLDFESALQVVIKRGQLMGEAARNTNGKMAAIIGMPQTELSQSYSNPLMVVILLIIIPLFNLLFQEKPMLLSWPINHVGKWCQASCRAPCFWRFSLPFNGICCVAI